MKAVVVRVITMFKASTQFATLFAATLAVGLFVLVESTPSASAQPGYGQHNGQRAYQPPAPGPRATAPYRFGLTVGVELGLGSMTAESGPIVCEDCDVEPITVAGSFEIGAMINPRLAILFHLRGSARALDADGVNVLWNSMGLAAAKYWVNRQLWVKGGLGFAALGITYDDGFVAEDEQLDEGGAGLLAIGYEILHSRRFAIDLSATVTSSVFDELDDTINTGIISLGASWF